jgi:hypothetical protein
VGPVGSWKQREHLSLFQVLLKLTANLRKGKNLVISNHQKSMRGEEHGWYPGLGDGGLNCLYARM